MTESSRKWLKKVIITADVYAICLQHVLSTEKEEVMGILLGNVDEVNRISHISACTILSRLDKQPDRVEISPEQLFNASMYAETLTKRLGRQLRVIGWYHSHPHITVWPSHVDLRTQALYEMMDNYFVGIIFSVYPKNTGSSDNQIQMIAFQSQTNRDDLNPKIEIDNSRLESHNLEALTTLPKMLVQEEVQQHQDKDQECPDLLIKLHNDALKTLKHVHIVSKITRPMCDDLEERLNVTNLRIEELRRIKKNLQSKK
ncbi:PREDICTED: lys-63-specific deubiquitinase BRCC36-like [Nicrophorus vespilloides]|uniref:Lys-63-specific deubiquitinase BRCC36-like n=1 Tax=Nicrophorus vespilloides TaxID=110193 RepID=A0ABM1MLW5_NICVS|nr:PREDICTED: lys-63-specific deubiquitinase BRCC36-like [Nicrophorus vespilloides]XP_017775565.1 PREDICTED: lys-63-specific deubiquitinase BRCC36-like [Nicrophorus vespilloides]